MAEAFNNVHHKHLLRNLRKEQVPECMVKWLDSFLKNRSTKLQFKGATSGILSTPVGIPQRSPPSPVLYIYYNADLLEITEERDRTIGLEFIDDIVYRVNGASDKWNG